MSVHRQPNGKWRVMWREPGGGQRSKTFTGERDARRADREIASRLELGTVGITPKGKAMTGADLYADWKTSASARLSVNSMSGYAAAWKHLQPLIGSQDVRLLDGPACAAVADQLNVAGHGKATQAKCLALLSALLRHAVMRRLLPSHPMRGVVRVPQPKRRRVVEPPTPETIWRLADAVEALDGGAGRVLVLLMGFAGLRPEEALALDWRDVGQRTLNIDKAAVHGVVGPTKTGSARTVDLVPALEAELVSWRLASGLPAKGLVLGKLWNDSAYRNWRKRKYQPAAEAVDASPRPYDLRHAFASLLLAEQRNVLDVAAQLGHAPSMCLDTYGHVMRELAGGRKVNAAKAVERARKSVAPVLHGAEGEGVD